MSGGTTTVVSGRRHEARITALQALFEIDTATHGIDEVLGRYHGNAQMPEGTRRFIESLVRGVMAERVRLDAIIGKNAPTWPVPQLPAIDRTVLRMALWELLIERDDPGGAPAPGVKRERRVLRPQKHGSFRAV